jgi:hypothetical protein
MSFYGRMHSYDSANAMGWLTPEDGSERIPFARAEQFWVHHKPLIGSRYRYDIRPAREGQGKRAANVQLFEGPPAAVNRRD